MAIAKRQIQASVVSANRQNWINDLRECVSGFMTSAKLATVEDALASSPARSFAADAESHNEAMKQMTLLYNKAALLINPGEEDHRRLANLMIEMIEFCSNGDPLDYERHNELQDLITKVSQQVLKREWERVKRGE